MNTKNKGFIPLNSKHPMGFTLVEIMVVVVIIGIIFTLIVQTQHLMSRQSQRTKNRAFASQKTIQMMEELSRILWHLDLIYTQQRQEIVMDIGLGHQWQPQQFLE